MIRILAHSLLILECIISGCSHSVNPIIPQSKDPRTYSWTLDTLYYTSPPQDFGQTVMLDIWGLNDTLIYAVGHDATFELGAMWKYEGKKWERVHLSMYEGGTLNRTFSIYAIKGFAENNIYAFGTAWTNSTGKEVSSTAGIHYDGTQWYEISMPQGKGISSFVASSPTTMYCGGLNDGQLYHFDGIKWSVDTITNSPFPDLEILVSVMGVSSTSDVYFQTNQFKNLQGGFEYKQTIKRNYTKSIVLDSAYNNPPWGGRSFWQSKAGNIYSCGSGGIYLLSGDKWKTFYSSEDILSMFGTSDEHIFAVGISNIYFYDGNNWEIICPYRGTTYQIHLWCSETKVFISFSDGTKTYVLHGK